MYMRDQRKPLELSEDELQELVTKFEAITGVEFDAKSADMINDLIGILRDKYLIEQWIPDNKKIRADIEQVQRCAEKLHKLIVENPDFTMIDAFQTALPHNGPQLTDILEHINLLIDSGETAKENLSKRKKSDRPTFTDTRQDIATELARELARKQIKITKYRDGHFGQCLREFLESCNGETPGGPVRIYVPEDLLTLIKTAADTYQEAPLHILLQFR